MFWYFMGIWLAQWECLVCYSKDTGFRKLFFKTLFNLSSYFSKILHSLLVWNKWNFWVPFYSTFDHCVTVSFYQMICCKTLLDGSSYYSGLIWTFNCSVTASNCVSQSKVSDPNHFKCELYTSVVAFYVALKPYSSTWSCSLIKYTYKPLFKFEIKVI